MAEITKSLMNCQGALQYKEDGQSNCNTSFKWKFSILWH